MDKRRIGVRAIIFKDGQLLANKFPTETGETDYWATPGGGLDPHESLTDGLTREIIEETGIVPHVGRLLFVQQFRSERPDRSEELEFFFLVTNPEDFTTITLSETTHGAHELTRCEFIDPRAEVLLPAFLQTIDIVEFTTRQQPVYFYTDL
jgi:ADP-ribose pyrophosphatase YjhB (NUDIX family)